MQETGIGISGDNQRGGLERGAARRGDLHHRDRATILGVVERIVVGHGAQRDGLPAMSAQVERGLVGWGGDGGLPLVAGVELDFGDGVIVRRGGPHQSLLHDDVALARGGDAHGGQGLVGPLRLRVAVGGREIASYLAHAQPAHGDLAHVVGAQSGPGGPAQVGDGGRVVSHHQRAHRVHGYRVGPGQDQPHRGIDQVVAVGPIGQSPQSVQDDKVWRASQVEIHDVPPQVVGVVRERALEHV